MSIFGDRVTVPPDARAPAWFLSRLGNSFTVGGLVPSGFERYAFVRCSTAEEVDDGGAELVSELAVVAERHTSMPDLIWYAIWEGYGWETTTELYAAPNGPLARASRVRERRTHRRAVRGRAGQVREGLADTGLGEVTSFDVSLRRYFLVGGPESVSVIARPDGFGFQVPDLWWPQDRSWLVASDTDLDWSYIGGSEDFVPRVFAAIPGTKSGGGVGRSDHVTSRGLRSGAPLRSRGRATR